MAHTRCFSYMLIVAWKKRGMRMAGGIGTVGSSSIFEEEKNDETAKNWVDLADENRSFGYLSGIFLSTKHY